MQIGTIALAGHAALAPMAGVADRAMREMCTKYGAGFCVGELTSAKGVYLGDGKSAGLLRCTSNEKPMACQLFGCEPSVMAEAARKALAYGCDWVDINMGCPAPKVALNGGGSALLKDPALCEAVARAVVKAVDVPVTAKIRLGWDAQSLNAVEVAKRLEQAGVAALCVHGRTRAQMYAPPVDLAGIRAVRQAVSIPLIGNGDVTDGPSARRMLEETVCDYVMVGRAAMGDPFVFTQINRYLEGLPPLEISLEQRLETLKEQVRRMAVYKGKRVAFLEARKHTAWYLKGLPGAAALRRDCGSISSMADVEKICEKALETNERL